MDVIRRAILAVSVMIGSFIFFSAPAFAGENPVEDSVDGGVKGADQADWLSLSDATNTVRLIGILLPIITAAITKYVASDRVKSLTTTVLAVIVATIAVLAGNDGAYHWQEFFNAFLNTFIPAIAVYYGLLKPTGVTDAVDRGTGNRGIGGGPRGDAGYTDTLVLGIVLLAVGLLLIFLTSGVFYVIGIICAVVGAILLVLGLVNRR